MGKYRIANIQEINEQWKNNIIAPHLKKPGLRLRQEDQEDRPKELPELVKALKITRGLLRHFGFILLENAPHPREFDRTNLVDSLDTLFFHQEYIQAERDKSVLSLAFSGEIEREAWTTLIEKTDTLEGIARYAHRTHVDIPDSLDNLKRAIKGAGSIEKFNLNEECPYALGKDKKERTWYKYIFEDRQQDFRKGTHLAEIHEALKPQTYRHTWKQHDRLLIDDSVMMHARLAFHENFRIQKWGPPLINLMFQWRTHEHLARVY